MRLMCPSSAHGPRPVQPMGLGHDDCGAARHLVPPLSAQGGELDAQTPLEAPRPLLKVYLLWSLREVHPREEKVRPSVFAD